MMQNLLLEKDKLRPITMASLGVIHLNEVVKEEMPKNGTTPSFHRGSSSVQKGWFCGDSHLAIQHQYTLQCRLKGSFLKMTLQIFVSRIGIYYIWKVFGRLYKQFLLYEMFNFFFSDPKKYYVQLTILYRIFHHSDITWGVFQNISSVVQNTVLVPNNVMFCLKIYELFNMFVSSNYFLGVSL